MEVYPEEVLEQLRALLLREEHYFRFITCHRSDSGTNEDGNDTNDDAVRCNSSLLRVVHSTGVSAYHASVKTMATDSTTVEMAGHGEDQSRAEERVEEFCGYVDENERLGHSWRPNSQSRYKIAQWAYELVDFHGYSREVIAHAFYFIDHAVATWPSLIAGPNQGENVKEYKSLSMEGFQLICASSIYLATKIWCGMDGTPISAHQMEDLSGGVFSERQIELMEMKIMTSLDWRIHPPTARQFLAYFIECFFQGQGKCSLLRTHIYEMSIYAIEFYIMDPHSILSKASEVAVGTLCCAIQKALSTTDIAAACNAPMTSPAYKMYHCQLKKLRRLLASCGQDPGQHIQTLTGIQLDAKVIEDCQCRLASTINYAYEALPFRTLWRTSQNDQTFHDRIGSPVSVASNMEYIGTFQSPEKGVILATKAAKARSLVASDSKLPAYHGMDVSSVQKRNSPVSI